MLSLFRKYILQLLICVCYDEKQYIIRCHTWKNSQPIDTFEKSFEDKEKVIEYIKKISKDFQIYYISTLFTPISQGIVPSSNYKELSKFGVDSASVKCLPFNNALLYVSRTSLDAYKQDYEKFGGLDLLFSPFSLLMHCLEKKSLGEKVALYAYRYKDFVAILICKKDNVYFGSYFNIASQDYEEEIFADFEEEQYDFEEEKSFEEENEENNYDLKSLEEMSKELENVEDLKEDGEELNLESLEGFSLDMKMIECILTSVKEFYNNPLYESHFLEELVIFDEENFNEASLDYLENELFIKPQVELVDTLDLMNELMLKDLRL